jgi:hypothetical protein
LATISSGDLKSYLTSKNFSDLYIQIGEKKWNIV